MGIPRDAQQRWRTGVVGTVPIVSPRGIAAISLLVIAGVLVLIPPALSLLTWIVQGEPESSPELNRELLALNLAANALLLLGIPILAIHITRPRDWGASAKRLAMTIDRKTGLWALLGAGVTFAALLVLGMILTSLELAGIYKAEESALVPQLQALLTPAVIVGVPIIAAVTEEVFFRGFLQPRVGIIASSVLFGLVHSGYGTILQLLAPFVLGLLFGILFQKTRSLWAPITAHFTFDFVQFLALYFLR